MTDINLPNSDLSPYFRRAHIERAKAAADVAHAAGRVIGNWAAAIAAAHTRRRLRRETVRELQSLSNRTLRDIGIPRSAIWSVADDLVNTLTGPVSDDHRHPHRARPAARSSNQTQAHPGHRFTTPVTAGCG